MDRFGNRYPQPVIVDVESIVKVFSAGSKLKDILPTIINISAENHKYLQQWKNARWDISTVKGILILIEKYELNDLQLQGKALWTLYMILAYGGKESPELVEGMRNNNNLIHLFHETLLKLLLEFTVYNQVIDIFRLLVNEYGFSAAKIFEIGSTLVSKIPGLINDDCYIALIHFAGECSRIEPISVTTAMPFLASAFALIGSDSNASYFLYRSLDFLLMGLTIDQHESFQTIPDSIEEGNRSPSAQKTSSTKQEIKDKTITYTLNLLRSLATIQPNNAKFIFNNTELFTAILRIIQNNSIPSENTLVTSTSITRLSPQELILREAISSLNALIIDEETRQSLKIYFPVTKLINIVQLNYLSVNEVIMEFYLLLYEIDLPYIYEEQKYSPIGSYIDQQFFLKMFQSLIINIKELFPSPSTITTKVEEDEEEGEGNGERREENDEVEGSSGSDEIEEEGVVADETSRSKKKKKRKTKGSHGVVLITSSTKVIKCNFIYRILFKMETSLHLVSDITQYTTEKLQLFQSILPILQSKSPLEWNLYYLPSMIDIIVLLFKGCEYCWEIPKIDLLDAEFLHISNQLINQFGQEQLQQQQQPGKEAITEGKEKDGGADEPQNTTESTKVAGGMLNNNRFFDSKDRNSLYYLVGCDDLSTIPSILRRSITNDSDRSVSIDQLNPTSPNAPQQPGSSPQTPTSTTGRKFLSLSRKNTFTKEEVNNLEASEGGNNKEDNDNKLELRRYYENALKLSTVSQYNECIQLIQSFKQYLLSNISIIETLIVNWELHTIDTNCQRLLFLYLLVHFFDLQDLLKKMYESNYIYDLLWRLIYQQQPNSSSSTSKLPINAVAIDRMGSSVNDRNKSVDNLYNIKPIYGMTRKCIQLLTIFVREKGSFEHSVHFAEFLHLLLTTRPERLRDITASQASSSMMSAADEVARDNNNNNSNENEMDRGASDDDLLLNTRDNVSLFANIAFRVSSVDLLAMIENPLNFRPSASGNNPDEFSSSNPVIIEDIVNMDLHYSAVSALLALSHFDRTVRRKMITYATNIIESLNFICPTDAINYKPMIYLVKSMIEFIAKLELVNEETIIGLILRCLKSPLLYIKSQICDLIYYIGIENPGFIYRGLSRNEVENELLFILTMTNPDNAILLLNTLKACCQIIHNINLKPVWIPVTWLSHWSKYPKNNTPLTVLIQGREFISVKTLLLILSLLDKCPKYYRLVYFTHILSFASSLMYACVEGVIPNTSPVTALASANAPPHSPLGHSILDADDENSTSLLPPPASPATPPSQYIRETLIQHILPLIPIAIDFIMTLGKKFNKQRKSITQIDNPIHARMAQADNVPDDSGKSNSGTSSIIPPGMPESYSQMIANRFYHNNDKKFNLWLLLQDINNYEQQSTASSSQGSGDMKEGSEIKSVEIPLEVLQGIIEEKLSTNPQYFLQDHTTYYPSNLSNRALPPPPTASPKSPPSLNSSSRRKNNNSSSNSSSQNAVSTISDRLQAKKVSPAQLLAIFKSKPIETLTERTIDCIYSFICTDEMFPLSTYLQHIHLFQTNPIIASISYFMTEHRQNTIILKRGLECVKYYAENQMHLSLIAMHSPLALIYTVKHLKEVIDIQLSFTKIIFMVSQINDDFAKENLIRFNIHYLLIEMIHSQQYELSKIALQCILSLLTNDTNAVALTQNTGLISSVSALLDSSSSSTSSSSGMSSSSSMNKDIKIQYYGIKILIMIDDYLPELISQSTNKSSKHALFSIMKKSRKSLINYLKTNYHYYYQNNIFQKTLNLSKNDGNNDNPTSATNGNGMIGGSAPASPTSGGSGKKGFASLNETIEKNDIEELLNHPIWQKEKCVIM